MAIKSDYISGSLSLTNGSVLFTGTGTGWESAGFQEGDILIDITGATEFMGVIEEITGETAGTLTKAWEGPTLTNVPYRMRYQPDGSRSTAQARNLIEILGNGNITAFASLTGAANTFPMFTGPGAMTTVTKQSLVSGADYDVQVDTLPDRAAYDGQDAGFSVLVSNIGDGRAAIYSKNSATSGDWSDPAYITGPVVAIEAGTTTTLTPGSDATVDVVPVPGGYELDFGIPRGDVGATGATGTPGTNGTNGVDGIDGTSLFSRVRVVSETNIDISNLNNGDTIDGVVVATNWLVLLAGQTDATENGIYLVGATAGTTVRAAAFDSYDELPGTYFSVMQGTVNADTLWKCSSDLGGTIGVDDLVFELFASSEGFMDRTYQSYALNSGVTYVLPSTPSSANSLDVYVGGILQPKDGLAYTYSGTTLTLSEDPGAVDLVEVYIFYALPMSSVPAGSVGSAEINAVQAAAIRTVLGILGPPREVLSANRTYYVRTDGSDSNNGLTNTSGGAFLTIQKAIDVAAALDLSIYNVTIQVGSGTYTGALTLKSYIGAGPIRLTGNTVTPSNVIISTTSNTCITGIGVVGSYYMGGFKLQTTTSGLGINISNGTNLFIDGAMDYGTIVGQQIAVTAGASLSITASYTISGGAPYHMFALTGAIIVVAGTVVTTLTGTPAFSSAFANVATGAAINSAAWSFSGSATGSRYSATLNGTINTAGVALPGNSAGTLATGGIFNTLIGGQREILTANRTYYVRTDGNNNNDGLTNTAGGAFATLQYALNIVGSIDISIYNVTIQLNAGTHAGAINVSGPWVGTGSVTILGDNTTPANVIVQTTGAGLHCIYVSNYGRLNLSGIKVISSGTGPGISADSGAVITITGNIEFGACLYHFYSSGSGNINVFSSYRIAGNADYHTYIGKHSRFIFNSGTCTLVGTPAFNTFALAAEIGFIQINASSVVFSGSATGVKYSSQQNSLIQTYGGASTFLPGSSPGSVGSGGLYQ